MGVLAEALQVFVNIGKAESEMARLKAEAVGLRNELDALSRKISGWDNAASKHGVQKLEAILSAGKFLCGLLVVAFLTVFLLDDIARLLRPYPLSLESRIEQFAWEHTAEKADKYLGKCIRELSAIKTGIVAAGSSRDASQDADKPPSGSPPSGHRPVEIGKREIGRLREACSRLLGD